MVHWNCSSALCFNNYKTLDSNGEKLKYYRLPKEKKVQADYQRIFKTADFNWKIGYICAAHWSSCERKSPNQLPDIPIPKKQYELLKLKYRRSKRTFEKAENPTRKQTLAFKNAKQKLKTAMTVFRGTPVKTMQRRQIIKRTTPRINRQREASKAQFKRKLELTTASADDLKNKLDSANKCIAELKTELSEKKEKLMNLEIKNLRLMGELENMNCKNFTYRHLKIRYVTLKYLCGFSVFQFDLVMECIRPYLHLIPYPESKVSEKSFSFETQFLVVLTVSRHGLDLRFMAFILGTSETTVQRIFNAWVIFLELT